MIADLLPHPFLELEQSCLEIDSPLSEPGEWSPLWTLSLSPGWLIRALALIFEPGSWDGSSWRSVSNPDTHSNTFGSFIRILQFSKKYYSLPASEKFPLPPFGKRFSTKGCTCFNWCIGTIIGKCAFGKSELILRKVSFFVEKTLAKWSFWLPWWLQLMRWLRCWCWLTSNELRRCE